MSQSARYAEHRQKMFNLMEKYLASNLTQKKFSEQENISTTTFEKWHKQYRQTKGLPSKRPVKRSKFIPLKLNSPQQTLNAFQCQIKLPDGAIINFTQVPEVDIILQIIQKFGA